MPVKNTSQFLTECIDSIIQQSYINWELIAIDDHSDDNSYDILQGYSSKNPKIQVYRNEGKGIIEALRLAYSKTKGSYITRMDSDDIMKINKLQELREALTAKNQIAVGLVEYISETIVGDGYRKYADWLNALTINENNFLEIYKECVIPSPCWMIHRNDLDACGAFNSDIYPEDYDLTFRLRNAGIQLKAATKKLHLWRDHSQRASRNDPNYLDNNFIDIKVKYFIESDYNPNTTLILWGAGKKGKKIASLLVATNIPFQWICNNPNKIGAHIYGVEMKDTQSIKATPDIQVIVAVAQRNAKSEIDEALRLNQRKEVFYFS